MPNRVKITSARRVRPGSVLATGEGIIVETSSRKFKVGDKVTWSGRDRGRKFRFGKEVTGSFERTSVPHLSEAKFPQGHKYGSQRRRA